MLLRVSAGPLGLLLPVVNVTESSPVPQTPVHDSERVTAHEPMLGVGGLVSAVSLGLCVCCGRIDTVFLANSFLSVLPELSSEFSCF